MTQRVAVVPQPYLFVSRPGERFEKTYQVGNGSLNVSVTKNSRAYSDILNMSVTDSVAEKEGAHGCAKFHLALTKTNRGEIRWSLTNNLSGNFSSKRMGSMHVEPYVREMLFYGYHDKLLGCFSLDKSKGMVSGSSGTLCEAKLLFGFHRRGEAVHEVKVKIMSHGTSFLAKIDEPTIASFDQLQFMRSKFSQMKSNVEEDDK